MARVLVVEDDKEINNLICEYLGTMGYETVSSNDGMKALELLKWDKKLDIALIDLMLPYLSGDRLLSKLREFSELPVIVVSAKDTVQTGIELIKMGADDYITKPFDLDELVVRIEAVLKRCSKSNPDVSGDAHQRLEHKNLVMDTEAGVVTVNGNQLELTGKEYAIIELLLRNPNKLFSKVNLFESVWDMPYFAEDNTLKVHMSNIRNKIKKYDDEEYIETIWGMGYRLKQN